MVNHEHAPNRVIDQYINPPLHPTNPKYKPERIAAKLARKRIVIRESFETFGKHQAAQAARRAVEKKKEESAKQVACEKAIATRKPMLTYEDNPIGYGWLTRGVDEPKLVSHNARTDHLFLYNEKTRGFDLIYQGSSDIVGFLEMHLAVDKKLEGESIPHKQRPLAFFDKKGRFHDQAILQRLDVHLHDIDGTFQPKHTAVFTLPHNDKYYETAVAIDDIHCLSLAKPADNRSRVEKLLDDI